ncbi:erythromycin esterase family protein [Nocardia sp. NPDC004568]|uniref:erythromycin esterase family protein n=1 Tax=Nocardia sp. NPDC004568 TaxID=3154551 RepID=UPI0033A549A5
MPAPSSPVSFADLLRDHAVQLAHLDPAAPLDDLEPLRGAIGAARVVAIGENSHFITEFSLLRRRILRFLVERCGFTVLAFEYGFSEGFALDAWGRGAGSDDDLAAHLAAAIPVGVEEPLHWIRRYNATAEVPVRFAGIDIPAAGGSLLPALAPVADYLSQVDPEVVPAIREAMRIAGSFAGASAAAAAPAWARLASAEQNALSAILARLLIRVRALAPLYTARGDQREYEIARRRLEAACHADYGFRAMAGLYSGSGLTADTSARDAFMAESVLWHLERSGPEARVVLAAHNAHIQRTPVFFDGNLTGLPMGQYLHDRLGDDYFALALTGITGNTADMRPDEDARFGFAIEDTPLPPPEPGSVEAAFADAGLDLGLADLRRARAHTSGCPDRIRIQSSYVHTPVVNAFDAVLATATSTVSDVESREASV